MFKPVSMKRIRVLLLDDYLDKVRGVVGVLRSVHMVKLGGKDIELISRGEILYEYSNLLNRIHYLMDILEIPKDKEIEKVPIAERSSDEYLEEIENNKGVLYDNGVSDACLRLFADKGFDFEWETK